MSAEQKAKIAAGMRGKRNAAGRAVTEKQKENLHRRWLWKRAVKKPVKKKARSPRAKSSSQGKGSRNGNGNAVGERPPG